MKDQFYNYVVEKTGQSDSETLRKASDLFEDRFNIAEVYFDDFFWKEKKNHFWFFDKIETAVHQYNAFKLKKEKFVADLEARTQLDSSTIVAELKASENLEQLEELYRPYKRKKKTKATLAREAGLQQFTDQILNLASEGKNFENGLESEAKKYINPSLGYITFETVLKGVQDIIVEKILAQPGLRKNLLNYALDNAKIKITAGEKYTEGGRFTNFIKAPLQGSKHYLNSKNYDKFPQIKKAWEDGFLKVSLDADWQPCRQEFQKLFVTEAVQGDLKDFFVSCAKKALEIHALPSVSGEVFEKFFEVSREVYFSKIKTDYLNLLTTPAFGDQPILSFLGRPQGESTFVLVSHSGDYISSAKVDLNAENVLENLKGLLADISKTINIGCVAISLNEVTRKAEKLVSKAFEDLGKKEIPVVMADATGVSRFISSETAKFGFEEKINNDALQAYYIAKRVQNPLFEYGQHEPTSLVEVPQFIEKQSLNRELKKCLSAQIAQVGILVKDFTPALAIHLDWFASEERALEVAHALYKESKNLVDKKSLESVLNADEFKRFAKFFKFDDSLSLLDKARISVLDQSKIKDTFKEESVSLLSGPIEKLNLSDKSINLLGKSFYNYLKEEFSQPFKDLRKSYKVFSFSKGVENIEDVKEGHVYWGIVTKFSSFGAFVDMGVGVEGLVHLSELSKDYLSDPRKVLKLGQWVLIKAIKVDTQKKQLSFSKTQVEQSGGSKKGHMKKEFSHSHKKRNGRSFSKSEHSHGNSKGKKPGMSKGPRAEKKPRQPFNNAFAALSELKK